MKNRIFLPFLISQVIAFNSIAQSISEASAQAPTLAKSIPSESKKLSTTDKWADYISGQIRNARLKKSINTPTVSLGSKASLFGNYEIQSAPSIASNYSGIDTWTLNLSGTILQNSMLSLGGSAIREVTFIQQFKNRTDSLARLPYDPITKLPVSAEKAIDLKEGDFVAYRAPMTISLGRGFSDSSVTNLTASAAVTVYATGEMDIHVYRMSDNNVRVRIFALKDKGAQLSFGTSLTGFNSVLKRLVDFSPLEVSFMKSKMNTYAFDYVFNLNDREAREAYDMVIGQNLGLNEILKAGREIFSRSEVIVDRLTAEVKLVNRLAVEDANKPIQERRLTRLSRSENTTGQESTGITSNLFNIVKFTSTQKSSESAISLYNVQDEKKNYLIKTYSRESNLKVIELLGQKSRNHIGIMIDADEQGKMRDLIGLQSLAVQEELNLSAREMNNLKSRLQKILPEEIMSVIEFPDLSDLGSKSIKNAYIKQALSFNGSALENLKTTDYHAVVRELNYLIQNWGTLNAAVMQDDSSSDLISARAQYLKEGNYKSAYSYELHYIPQLLSQVLNKNESIDLRVKNFDLLHQIPLFRELGSALIMRLIPIAKLKESVSLELQVSGRKIKTVDNVYPKNSDLKESHLFNQVVEENAFATNRSFNLRQYMNEDGSSMTLKQLTDRIQ